jgi:RNA polymerase sigma-70 factor (ECF subfamily)
MTSIFRRHPPSFEQLLRPHLDRLYRLAFRFTGARDDAEDLVQELCTRLLPRLDDLQRLERPGPWLARALHNLYVDQVRHRARSPVETVDEPPDVAAPGPDIEQLAGLTAERIAAALAQLPAEQRAVVAWHDIEGYTLEELADSQDLPLGTLKSRLHRGRAALRRLLREPFGGPGRVEE